MIEFKLRRPKRRAKLQIKSGVTTIDLKVYPHEGLRIYKAVQEFLIDLELFLGISQERSNRAIIRAGILKQIPIVISREEDEDRPGWYAEIPDSYENYIPDTYLNLNFENLPFHFEVDGWNDGDSDAYSFSSKKNAIAAAEYVNMKYLGNKARIWIWGESRDV